jgi:transposase
MSSLTRHGACALPSSSVWPIALGRKNHLFAGSDGGAVRWAIVASLLATANLNDIEPFAYLRDVLERLSDGRR